MPTLLFFAALREAAGARALRVDAASVGEALKIATETHGARFERVLGYCTILVNEQPVAAARAWDVPIGPHDEIALLPPVSGGGGFDMVDVGDKDETKREATAVCVLTTKPQTCARIMAGELAKGDPLAAARVAGALAAKRTPELIPLCHPVRTTYAGVTITQIDEQTIEVRATVRGRDRTGFEMEALTACSISALTLYDFAKAEDPTMTIGALRIVAKSGGKSGSVTFP